MPFSPCRLLAIVAVVTGLATPLCADIEEVRVGFDGLHRVGFWVPVWITLSGGDEGLNGRLSLVTVDGDGTPVRYAEAGSELQVAPGEIRTVMQKAKLGRVEAGITVAFTPTDGPLLRRSLSSEEFPRPQLSDASITLVLGPPLGVEALFETQAGRENRPLLRRITEADQLPTDWLAYEAIDTIVVTTRENRLLESLDDARVAALRRWVTMGGRLLLSVGSRGQQVAGSSEPGNPLGSIRDFVPGDFVALATPPDSAAIESYSGARRQLPTAAAGEPFQLTLLTNVSGRIELSDTGPRGLQPLVVRAPFGFGEVVFVAFDLDHPAMAAWEGRSPLLTRLLREDAAGTEEVGPGRFGGRVAHVGFTDLSGQLRGALDQFEGVSFVPFYAVAGLVFVYVLLIGPADYFLLRGLLGKMERTWFTMPVIVLGFSGLAIWLLLSLKHSGLQVNQVDLLDIDLTTRTVRGSTWADLYSPETETYSLHWQRSGPLAQVWQRTEQVPAWHGLPGTGLGGLNTSGRAPAFTDPYQVLLDAKQPRLIDVPVQVASTKNFQVRWWGEAELEAAGRLTVNRDQLLRGEVVNPLPVALDDCAVLYGDWLYRLESKSGKLGPGESIRIETEQPLNLEWKLTRRRVEESRDVSTPWNQDSVDIPRIVEMMMFHAAAGGESYTQLSHRYHGFLDLSHLLRRGRAILWGRGTQRSGDLYVDGENAESLYDQTWTYYRVVLPVQPQRE